MPLNGGGLEEGIVREGKIKGGGGVHMHMHKDDCIDSAYCSALM